LDINAPRVPRAARDRISTMADVEQPAPGQGQSKSAKRRAAQKKAKEAGEEAPVQNKENANENKKPEAKAKPAAAPAEPKAKAKGKAKAEPKEEPKPKAQPKAEPKAEPKAAAKPAAKPAAKSDAAKPKSEAKAKASAKAKAPAKADKKEEEERPAREPSPQRFIEYDDGTGGDWEVSTGITKKQAKRKEREAEAKAEAKAAGLKPGVAQNYIPGMGGPEPKAGAKGPAVSQSVSAPINAAATAAAVAEKEKEPSAPSSSREIRVPEARIGIVIGPKGAKIKMLQEKTGAHIDTSGEVFTVTGPPDGVSQAEQAIKELIDKGYCALEYEDFSEHFVAVHPSYFPEIIGKQGCVIRKIKDELGVSVNIPSDAPKNPPANKKYKVILAGKAADVEKAKEVINDIVMYYCHPITHPDQVHEEVEVPNPWCISFIIGKGGCELRHIQKNYNVKMNVPRDQSVNKNVVIVGERWNVDRAKAYVEKVLWNAEHAPRGRDKGEGTADDGWGDEEDVEDWMKDYLYKRR